MDKLFPVWRNGEYIGTVAMKECNGGVEFDAECNALDNAVYRIMAGKMSLGVLCPENGVLRARKRYSHYELKREKSDLKTLSSAVVEKVCNLDIQWQNRRIRDIGINDEILTEAVGDDEKVLYLHSKGRRYIATPINGEKGFLFAPVFTIAKIETINGIKHGVLQIDEKGRVLY